MENDFWLRRHIEMMSLDQLNKEVVTVERTHSVNRHKPIADKKGPV